MSLQSQRTELSLNFHYDVYVPAVSEASALLVCLHGYSQDKASSLKFGRSIGANLPIAALQAPHQHFRANLQSVGFGWVSPFEPEEGVRNHHLFVQRVIDKAYKDAVIAQPQAVLFGFSQSVSLNYRFARAHPDYLRGIIAVAGAAPSDWQDESEPKSDIPVLHIATLEDEAYPVERSRGFRDVLESHFSNLTYIEEPGAHRVPAAAYPRMLAWLQENGLTR